MDQQIFDVKRLISDYKKLVGNEEKQIKELSPQDNSKNRYDQDQHIKYQSMNSETSKQKVELKLQEQNKCQQKICLYDDSETMSLSLIKETQQQSYFTNYLDWQSVLNQYGDLFRPYSKYKKYIKTSKFQDILNDNTNFQLDQGSDTKIYSGTNIDLQDWIVIREQLVGDKSLLETAQQYVIHNQIYQLYPKIFLQLLLPVYVQMDYYEKLTFISQLEYGEINLYNYSQQNIIKDLEYELIFQQLYEQITLLHKHNIAHRDIKPQNIIFVENKGWLLCDFGDSINYTNVIDVYNIRGTYAFLQPYLQRQAKISGIMLEQNLFENDIYAFAITMIVIKYQIQYQIDIKDYLTNNQDPIINALLNKGQQNNIPQIISYELKYLRPQIKLQQSQSIDIKEIFSYIAILQNTSSISKLTDEIIAKMLKLIDSRLQLKDNNYIEINHACYLCLPQYLKEFQNLIKFSKLRQVKYWEMKIKTSNLIIFMDNIGLTDITYQYARQYLQNNYDFTIHIILLRHLLLFQQIEQAQQEFYQLLRFREFKQMTEKELLELVEFTLELFAHDIQIPEFENYCKEIQIKPVYLNFNNLILQIDDDQQFIDKLIQNINYHINIYMDKKLDLGIVFNHIESSFQYRNILTSQVLINKIINNNLKYYCPTFHWQKLKQYKTNINLLLENKKKAQEQMKKMNYIVIYNSESISQQHILRLLKLNILSNYVIKKKHKQNKILDQIEKMVAYYDQLSFQYYKWILITEILDMIYNTYSENTAFRYFKILMYINKRQHQLQPLNIQDQQTFICFIAQFSLHTLNTRRQKQILINKKEISQERTFIKNQQLGYQQMKGFFLINQYLERF